VRDGSRRGGNRLGIGARGAAPQFNPDTHAALMEQHGMKPNPRKKKKVVKKWRDEWVETYKWPYVAVHEGTPRIFCSVCKEYGRKHRRNPLGNEGSRNMQISALEEHNNSLLHKEALRLQMASKDKGLGLIDLRPVFIKGRQVVQYPISTEHGMVLSSLFMHSLLQIVCSSRDTFLTKLCWRKVDSCLMSFV